MRKLFGVVPSGMRMSMVWSTFTRACSGRVSTCLTVRHRELSQRIPSSVLESAAEDLSVIIVAYLAKGHIWLSEGSISTELESAENEASVSCMQHLRNREARRAPIIRICNAIHVKQSVLSELIFFPPNTKFAPVYAQSSLGQQIKQSRLPL